MVDFNQTWQESSLGAGDSHVALMGGQGEGPQGPKPCKFQIQNKTVKLCSV